MISAGLAVEGHAHGGLGLPGHAYMTYSEPWRQPAQSAKQEREFLRPAPKSNAVGGGHGRYNGSLPAPPPLNGTRLLPPPSRSSVKYPSPPSSATPGPVNLTQQIKDEAPHTITSSSEELSAAAATYSAAATAVYSRMYQQHQALPPGFTGGLAYQGGLPHYGGLYAPPYSPLMRTNFVQPPPLSPLETYSPPSSSAGTFITPNVTSFPGQHIVKPGQSVLRDKRGTISLSGNFKNDFKGDFKVPSGKEGSLKHRILTRPPGESPPVTGIIGNSGNTRKRLQGSALSPPMTPTKPVLNTNNNTIPGNFTKGSLIQLATGELRRVEDMRTEDFVLSAEHSPELRFAESTVVKIEESQVNGTAIITLSYNQNRTQVEFEATIEHPFFLYGLGWSSCNPDRTLQCYGLKVHRLQVGDILVSLTPREGKESKNQSIQSHHTSKNSNNNNTKSSTITTTATTTAMTALQVSRTSVSQSGSNCSGDYNSSNSKQHYVDKMLLPPPAPVANVAKEPLDVSCSNARKRRWSAPDQICDDDEQTTRRHKE